MVDLKNDPPQDFAEALLVYGAELHQNPTEKEFINTLNEMVRRYLAEDQPEPAENLPNSDFIGITPFIPEREQDAEDFIEEIFDNSEAEEFIWKESKRLVEDVWSIDREIFFQALKDVLATGYMFEKYNIDLENS